MLIGWTTALAALAASTAALGAGVWLVRQSIAEFLIGAVLAERGVVADFQVATLELNHASITDLRIGSETAPDAGASRIEARWRWRSLVPSLTEIRVQEPRLRLRIDETGRISAGTLDQMRARPSAERAGVPAMRLIIEEGEALIEAPFGALAAAFSANGVLGRDFAGVAQIAETSRANGGYALERGSAELTVMSRQNALAFRLTAQLDALQWGQDQRIEAASLRALARAPLDLSQYDGEAALRIEALAGPQLSSRALSANFTGRGIAREDALAPNAWQVRTRMRADRLTLASNRFDHIRLDARADGRDETGRGGWTLAAQSFDGLALSSAQPSASGDFALHFDTRTRIDANARLLLAQSRLDARAQERIRSAFPNLSGAPLGPTFAQAESALDRAADRFDITLPLVFHSEGDEAHISVAAPVEARAASGLVLQIAPLRHDEAALDVQWPSLAAQGAVSIELSGGGGPAMTLLLDRLAWAQDAPFETEGTLAVSSWRAGEAAIAANQLDVGLAIAQNGEGRLDLRGPARITGPLGEGQVRDLVADLDLVIAWDEGWRVAPHRGCLPVRVGGIDAAGLSFANSAFALCPQGGALIAADANNQLSGGFDIAALSLAGRMAGPEGQPTRLSTRHITARFGGTSDNARLLLQADAPTLDIAMAEDRTLKLIMARLTAEARIADSWRVDGAFERGELTDPSLPGSVSAIAGRWSAAPENNEAVIRVAAGEALLLANRPASDEERPLFNPLRLREMNALVRGGRINAEGAIVLAQNAHRLARFTAEHDTAEGAGVARVLAPDLVFDPTLQPHDISELARGLVADVRGPASASAEITWTRETIGAGGRLVLNGVSLATATLPVIQGVRGEITFDDLFNLTTPPGQELSIEAVNPGISVRDGRVRFQLLADQRIAIENAEFAFASGVLAVTPATIRLGEDETRIELTLLNVDAESLVSELKFPDLAATGQLEGSFPLLLTRRSAYVQNGLLRAAAGGGFISYTGTAGDNAAGPARLAFQALRNFRYDNLSLTLDGDLSGEVVSAISFTGENSGDPVDLGDIAPVPGLGNVEVRGVPFVFNVIVTAPFRRLAETTATIIDPGSLIERVGTGEQDPAEPGTEPVEPRPPDS